jgi:hypothetical protein
MKVMNTKVRVGKASSFAGLPKAVRHLFVSFFTNKTGRPVNVLAMRWRKSNKNLLRVGHFSVHRNFQRTSVVSVSTILVNGVTVPILFFLFPSPD